MTNSVQTTPEPTTQTQTLVDRYFDCWNSTTAEDRAAAVSETWTEDGTNTDPMGDVTGHDALLDMFAGTQAMYPGHTFRQVGAVDAHHNLVRWGWEMIDTEGTKVLDGIDVAEVASDGRLSRLAGFFGAAVPDS